MSTRPKVLVVLKRTTFRRMVIDSENAHVKGLLRRGHESVARLRASHDAHEAAVDEVLGALDRFGVSALVVDSPPQKIGARIELVVTVGGDGTLLTTSHGIGKGVPLLGVNSAPKHSVGFFCAARAGGVAAVLERALAGKLRKVELTRMRVTKNEKVLSSRVLNEALFCHASPAATSRYILRVGEGPKNEEEQRSSGLWIGPAAGSTAAQRSAGGRILPLSSRAIQYVVREPYTPLGERLRLVVGQTANTVWVTSKMGDARLFLDGGRETPVQLGDELVFRRSDESLVVLGLTRRRAS